MKKKICFVALRAYPLLAKKNLDYGGGPEVLQTTLGRALLRNGFDVSFVLYADSAGVENIDGITVIKVNPKKSKLIRSFLIWKAMHSAKADIYYHHSGAAPIVALFCKFHKTKLICHIGSDGCVLKGTKGYNIWWFDIKLASLIIVQSSFQKAKLKENFNRESIIIRNIFPITFARKPIKAVPRFALWAGAMAQVKQPWLFLKLARKLPQLHFRMMGGEGDSGLFEFIKKESAKIPNLIVMGYVPFNDTNQYFERAAVLVNTSKFEGYSNAFIQSWMNYTPVISLNSDPDEIICTKKLGFHSRSFEKIANDIKLLLEDDSLREEMGQNARKFVEIEHNFSKTIDKYCTLLSNLA